MKKLLQYLGNYKKESILGPLFKLLEASFELIVPLVMAAIIDTGVANADRPYIMKMSLVLFLLALIGLACAITAQYFAAKAAVGCATGLRHALFEHIETLSFTEMDTVGTSTLITRMTSDVNQVQNGVNLVLRLFLRSPFIVFGAMIMAFTIDVKAALVFVVTIPLLSVVVFGIMLVSIPLYKKVQAALDKVLGITRENLTGSRVIRAFNKEQDEIAQFHEDNEALTKIQLYVGKISALMNPLTYIIINGASVVLVWVGAIRVDNGNITQGQVVALVSYMSQILVELIKLANLIININKSIACMNRIETVLDMESSITEQSAAETGSITPDGAGREGKEAASAENAVVFSKVGLTYAGASEEALSDIDFTVRRGETIGIIGGTGSGKSSVVNLIPRFYDATRGEIFVDGKNVRDYTLTELRAKVGVVLQKAVLFKGTIRENLSWGNSDATDEEMYKALETAQAREFVDAKEGGLSYEIEQGGRNLSGGQRQRLTIARALVKKPEILIMDDSASALDFATDAALRKAIAHMDGQMTVFIVSQRAASIMQADKIVVLDDGEIVGLGTHEDLLKECEVYREIYESQFKRTEEQQAGEAKR
ncbi:ABC transporter ATP-binding protein [Roseburia hominis]|uniref:ABC transporter ATP-binding protein n=1 Tax=Roseburia hominis TaxID=301301 RepID=UPI0026E98882|nr:ABC transporter ATP-binding protein [Roseburia hominis]MCI7523485.1 ABC transporter ATP-binding protein/permease [Roseburia hominis]